MQKSNPLRAITTRYQGYAFRSRLEARWAVFFDHLKIRWDYEPEGFELGNGLRYLPDFWLPDWKIWVEVKPDAPDDVTAEKASRLAAQSEYPIFVTNGMPGQGGTLYLCNALHGSRCGEAEVDWAAEDGKFLWLFTDELRRDMALRTAADAEIFTVPADRSPQSGVVEWYSPGAQAAVGAARAARFEFGAKGGAV